ncbi:metalloregulator ArsR/SmtB family transcription factor [Rheinheimera maricola]|uniref:Metalloregulator ArsR/SmtB family transcription factor n=1 Tax=Rheinheimera maricola TaxID=2793282 RepID=A0ABS7X8J6_9GAMM|nr:metalloregulator ArsR/SmtB family transcription factor [Rheinheimera maricola]MBZ9611519.1 metalloregulator ArsR/SmtB family transcription factor [Rheinheimera maricola]
MNPVTLYKAMADTTRLKAILLLQQTSELCVCDLMLALDESQPKVSRHLALLKQAGVLQHRKQGLWVFYRLNTNLPGWVHDVLQQTAVHNTAFIKCNLARLAQNPANTCC